MKQKTHGIESKHAINGWGVSPGCHKARLAARRAFAGKTKMAQRLVFEIIEGPCKGKFVSMLLWNTEKARGFWLPLIEQELDVVAVGAIDPRRHAKETFEVTVEERKSHTKYPLKQVRYFRRIK